MRSPLCLLIEYVRISSRMPYPSQEYHVLRVSLICDGSSLPLLSWIVPSEKQQNAKIQKAFLDALAGAINPKSRVLIVTDAGFQNAWFNHIKSLGWDFIGRIRGKVKFRLQKTGGCWHDVSDIKAEKHSLIKAGIRPVHLGSGTLGRAEYARCDGHFYFHKKQTRGRKHKHSRCRIHRKSQVRDARKAAKEPWLISLALTHVDRVMQPRIKPSPGNAQHPTHRHDTPYSAVLIDKAVLR